jgi:hypothetical protein
MSDSVIRDWVCRLSWKEQTVLLVALRGPDLGGSRELKTAIRWIRAIVLKNAAPQKTFMKEVDFPKLADLAEEQPLVFDMLSVHFITHLMHAMQVIGYRHPNQSVAEKALGAYLNLCQYLHLNPESNKQMTSRLVDEV